MSRGTLIALAAVGLAASALALVAYFQTVPFFSPDVPASWVEQVGTVLAAAFAAIVLLGAGATRWFWIVPIVVFSAFSALGFVAQFGAWFILHPMSTPGIAIGYAGDLPSVSGLVWGAVIAFVLYLIAATLYGFAGQAQGVTVGKRTGLLVLLLLSVLPCANVLGMIGFVIVAARRTTPAPPAASA